MNLICDEKKVENWGALQRKYLYYHEFQLPLPHEPDGFWLRREPVVASTGLLDKEIESSEKIPASP
jgi:hypothetical protein